MFDSFISKVGMKALALISATLLISAVTFAPTVTRGWGFGMMDENETTTSKDNSPEALFAQNQANCLNLDDGWWSPIAGPILVKACGPPANTEESSNLRGLSKQTETSAITATESIKEAIGTPEVAQQLARTSTPPTLTETSTPPTDVTETTDKEGNTVLSSTIQNLTITAIAATQSIKEDVGTPEVAQQVLDTDKKQVLDADKKDYGKGLVEGVKVAFNLGEGVGKRSKVFEEEQRKYTPEQINSSRSLAIHVVISDITKEKSDAFILGFSRGLTVGADFVKLTGVSGIPHKQLHPTNTTSNG